jgi:hypothetical protein
MKGHTMHREQIIEALESALPADGKLREQDPVVIPTGVIVAALRELGA